MINDMKNYDFVEGTDFDGLMAATIDKAPGTVGESEISTKFSDTSHGSDAMKVVDWFAFFDSKGGDDKPEPEPEPEVVRPDETENTPEQQQTNDDLIAGMSAESGSTRFTMSAESINNITVPEGMNRNGAVSGAVQNGATFTNEVSGRSIMIMNTSEEPADISVISSNNGKVYIKGDYNDVYLEGNLPAESAQYANIHGTISVADTDEPVAINVNFVGEDCGVTYLGDEELSVTDGTTAATPNASPTIYAPNATVSLAGKYDEVTATVSENTLILKGGFHANKLILKKGNIFVNGVDINDFVDELVVPDGCVISYAEFHVSQDNNTKLMASSMANGKIILDTDIELTKGRALSALASGKEVIDLNGHTWKCGDTRATESNLGSFYLRNSANATLMDSVGGGVFENNHADYLIFTNGANVVVNVMSGEYRGYTHTLYSLLGTINVYGGTFKLLDAETAERDVNGNLKFLLNCYDANYTAGTAKIKVYGGKFYEFNPSVTYGEPGGPVSYVAEGYHVVESVEDGKKVYEVVAD